MQNFSAVSLLLSLLLFSSATSQAQSIPVPSKTEPKTPSDSSSNFSDESFVVEHLESILVINPDATGYRQRTIAIKLQSDAALRQFGVVTVPFASASEHVEIVYARVRRPDGSTIDTPPADALEQPEAVTREAPFYSDLKEKQLPIKSLRIGDTIEWQVRVVRTKAEAPGQSWGQENFIDDAVTRSESFELRLPRATSITVWTNPKLALKPTESMAGDQHIYRWEHDSLKPTAGKQAEAEKQAKKKTLWTADEELDAREGKLPSIAWTTFKSWEAVGAWYQGLEAERSVPDANVKAKVAELTNGKLTEEDKVRAVYNYVSTQIRYIGVSFGIGRYQPHPAGEVLDNQYGDCKDKHTLLAAMLTTLGLHPDAVLIGAGIRFNEAVPAPIAFNHLITRVQVGAQDVWLDSTAEIAPYRVLYLSIRDKQALVIPDTGIAKLDRTPANLPFEAVERWQAVGSLDKDGISNSHLVLTARGDDELILRQLFRQTTPAQYDELVQRFSGNIGYAGTTSHAEIARPDDTSAPFTLSYDYHREKAGDWDHYRTIPQLMPVAMPMVDDKDPPVQSIELGVPRTEISSSEMKLPDGWGVELPEAVHEKAAFATYDLTYRFADGKLYAERKLTVLQRRLPATDWKTYKKWQDAVSLGNETFIQLTRTNAGDTADSKADMPSSTRPPLAAISNTEAEKMITKAVESLQQHNIAAASSDLDQAKELNPQQKFLWSAIGYMTLLRGEPSEAIRDFQKELTLHPDSLGVYPMMAQTQQTTGKRADAIATLRNWAIADPTDPTPTTRLVAMLVEDDNPTAAVEAATIALNHLPEDRRADPALQLAYGEAEMKAGMESKGAATLVAVLKTADDPQTMNSAAYDLADANKELPLAESTEQAALDKLSAETATWTLDESPLTLHQKSALLIASWDTMGWILFREGKLDQAADYVEAAWHNIQQSVVGEHLGDIRAAQKDFTPALAAYELALAALPHYDNMGVRTPDSPKQKALAVKIDHIKKLGGNSTNKDPANTLQQLRNLPLGSAAGRDGVAEYLLLIANNKIERVQPTTAKSITGGANLILKARLPDLTPAASNATLVHAAMLNCHSGNCELVLEP